MSKPRGCKFYKHVDCEYNPCRGRVVSRGHAEDCPFQSDDDTSDGEREYSESENIGIGKGWKPVRATAKRQQAAKPATATGMHISKPTNNATNVSRAQVAKQPGVNGCPPAPANPSPNAGGRTTTNRGTNVLPPKQGAKQPTSSVPASNAPVKPQSNAGVRTCAKGGSSSTPIAKQAVKQPTPSIRGSNAPVKPSSDAGVCTTTKAESSTSIADEAGKQPTPSTCASNTLVKPPSDAGVCKTTKAESSTPIADEAGKQPTPSTCASNTLVKPPSDAGVRTTTNDRSSTPATNLGTDCNSKQPTKGSWAQVASAPRPTTAIAREKSTTTPNPSIRVSARPGKSKKPAAPTRRTTSLRG